MCTRSIDQCMKPAVKMLHQIFRCKQRIIRPQESEKLPSLLFPALVVEFFSSSRSAQCEAGVCKTRNTPKHPRNTPEHPRNTPGTARNSPEQPWNTPGTSHNTPEHPRNSKEHPRNTKNSGQRSDCSRID